MAAVLSSKFRRVRRREQRTSPAQGQTSMRESEQDGCEYQGAENGKVAHQVAPSRGLETLTPTLVGQRAG
jgi:hypothetical protein